MEGELPEGWEIGKISDFSKSKDEAVQTGPFGAQLHSSDYVEKGVPLILIKNVFGGKIIEKNLPRITHDKASELSRYQLKKGDVVFSRVGSVGRVAVVQEHQEGWLISGQMLRVRLENPEIDSKFLNYMIQTNWFSQALENEIVGTTRKSINSDILRNLPLIKPPISVQRQIVAVLEQAEAVKRQRQEADALTGALLQSVFCEMFGDPVRNERGFDIANLNEICDEITVGVVVKPASYYVENEIPALRSLNIKPDRLDLTNLVYFNSFDNDTVLAKSKINAGDVLVVRTGYPGTACVVPPELDGANCIDLIILRPKKNTVNCDYLSRFLNSEYGKAQALAGNTGLAQQHLNIGAIRQVKIPLPPLALQQQFARVVESVERIREQQGASGKEIEGLCEGLMARAFAGELVA